ncbi:glycoside hydrolase family 68 protein, partial [Pseudomonas syringae pv. actinidiae]
MIAGRRHFDCRPLHLAGNINYEPTVWSRADALKVNENDPTTTQPLVSADFPVMSDTVFIW